jgi:putative endonuclease
MMGFRQIKGAVSYHSGLAAEESVATVYARAGLEVVERRWRGSEGEIDLIARDGDGFVFIEVKKSRTHGEAAQQLSRRQISRIFDAATEYVGLAPLGLMTQMRFDVALVDAVGRVEVLENAMAA